MGVPAGENPGLLDIDWRIVVCFRVIGSEVAGLTEEGGKAFEPRRDFSLRSHVLGWAVPGGIHPGDERKAGRSANRLRETPLKEDPFSCQLIECGRAGQLVPVATQVGVVVLADEPKDVWPLRGLLGRVRDGTGNCRYCRDQSGESSNRQKPVLHVEGLDYKVQPSVWNKKNQDSQADSQVEGK